jgi:hypothetical protein
MLELRFKKTVTENIFFHKQKPNGRLSAISGRWINVEWIACRHPPYGLILFASHLSKA